jgi:hypothetical protein
VAIIIMLSGLENIPRITELKEIQIQYKASRQDSIAVEKLSGSEMISISGGAGISSDAGSSDKGGSATAKDETLILPFSAHTIKEAPAEKKAAPRHIAKPQIIEEAIPPRSERELSTPDESGSHAPRHRVVVARDPADQAAHPAPRSTSHESSVHGIPQSKKSSYSKDFRGFDEKHLPRTSDDRLRTKETERQIIERELQRQRTMAISGRTPKTGSAASSHPEPTPEIVRFKRVVTDKTSQDTEHEPSDPDVVVHQVHRKRTVVIQKKKVHPVTQDTPVPEDPKGEVSLDDDDLSVIIRHEVNSRQMDSEDSKVSIKNSAHKSKDEIFEGKGVQKPATPQVRDSALIHTDLKSKKNLSESKDVESEPGSSDHVPESSRTSKKREKNTPKKDDISWK